MSAFCEDYPCCGHTSQDPCAPQWYDAPDAFDTTVNPHALCDHENGDCEVEPEEDEEEDPTADQISTWDDKRDDPDWDEPIDTEAGAALIRDWANTTNMMP